MLYEGKAFINLVGGRDGDFHFIREENSDIVCRFEYLKGGK